MSDSNASAPLKPCNPSGHDRHQPKLATRPDPPFSQVWSKPGPAAVSNPTRTTPRAHRSLTSTLIAHPRSGATSATPPRACFFLRKATPTLARASPLMNALPSVEPSETTGEEHAPAYGPRRRRQTFPSRVSPIRQLVDGHEQRRRPGIREPSATCSTSASQQRTPHRLSCRLNSARDNLCYPCHG
ncbi:hypothetical protein BD311DRAFT_495298 [Dichomitus squalens]|uniref:Uncharacterized protein n=1 Tax=Dichomitus squalens TaxID=114155 RepID=A0A4Q9MG68_9APHY|nr:hypothetical protein BD311DRAFT_495298 [Dichomitus squalens]